MRTLPFLLVTLGAAALRAAPAGEEGVVRSEEYNFEIRTPPDSMDWDILPVTEANKKQGCVAHLRTFYADADPPAGCDVYLWVRALSKEDSRRGVKFVANRWRDGLEGQLEHLRDRVESASKFGGADAWECDVKGDDIQVGSTSRMHWILAMNGKYLYCYTEYRTHQAVKDPDLDGELKTIRGSFKFLELRKAKADRKGPSKGGAPPAAKGTGAAKDDAIPEEKLARRVIQDSFWKFKTVKPKGLLLVPTARFTQNEKDLGVRLKMERRAGQTSCMIRVYVASTKSGQRIFTIEELAKRTIKYFEKTYKKTMRMKPEIDKRWKLGPTTKKSLALKLVGRRTVPEVTHWYFATCKNGRQYQLEVHVTGGTGEKAWKQQVDDFLKTFTPLK